MESLTETIWDVLISGTGLAQSLLALALSRSGKKVLHIDKNDYYGGNEAALSLQEVDAWAKNVTEGSGPSPFRNVKVWNFEEAGKTPAKLGFSRAYSLSLSPQLVYARSNLLPALVSSKVYRQLDFLAVGSWWIYDVTAEGDESQENAQHRRPLSGNGSLRRIPGGREDVFGDKSIDLRSTRALMRFLKLAADVEAHQSILDEWGDKPFPDFLTSHLQIPKKLHHPLFALTTSPDIPAQTTTSYALPRIHRHLTSTGMFGPGFGSVIPKWGGLAEIAQVACRAGAVGGGVYVLKKGFEHAETQGAQTIARNGVHDDRETSLATARLTGGEEVKTKWIVGSSWDLPPQMHDRSGAEIPSKYFARSITIVSSPLAQLFPSPTEGAPPSAGAVIVFPTGTLLPEATSQLPVYLMVHSSDTGECPAGQCVIYAHAACLDHFDTHSLLQHAVDQLLASFKEIPPARPLWSLHYDQKYTPPATKDDWDQNIRYEGSDDEQILQFPDIAPGTMLEDDVLKHVRAAYRKIMGGDEEGFMLFNDREGTGADEEDEDEAHA